MTRHPVCGSGLFSSPDFSFSLSKEYYAWCLMQKSLGSSVSSFIDGNHFCCKLMEVTLSYWVDVEVYCVMTA